MRASYAFPGGPSFLPPGGSAPTGSDPSGDVAEWIDPLGELAEWLKVAASGRTNLGAMNEAISNDCQAVVDQLRRVVGRLDSLVRFQDQQEARVQCVLGAARGLASSLSSPNRELVIAIIDQITNTGELVECPLDHDCETADTPTGDTLDNFLADLLGKPRPRRR